MSPDLDPAVEAAARHIGELSTVSKDRARWFAERAITAAAPLIRAQERAAVAEEIAAHLIEDADDEAQRPGRDHASELIEEWLRQSAAIAREHAQGRPEHTTPREKP